MSIYRIGFWGGGKMAEGILSALILTDDFAPKQIIVSELVTERAQELADKYGVVTTADSAEVAKKAEVIFLAVRPQDITNLAQSVVNDLQETQLVVSIAAGKTLASLRSLLGDKVRLIRVMPNLALRAKEGMCAIAPDVSALQSDVELVQSILNSAGRTIVLEEKHFDAVTAMSGSGPAFYAYLERAFVTGCINLGLPADAARVLAEQTMLGTATFLRQSNANLDKFIQSVATPGGTTAAGMEVLENSNLTEILASTLRAAEKRSVELGKLK